MGASVDQVICVVVRVNPDSSSLGNCRKIHELCKRWSLLHQRLRRQEIRPLKQGCTRKPNIELSRHVLPRTRGPMKFSPVHSKLWRRPP